MSKRVNEENNGASKYKTGKMNRDPGLRGLLGDPGNILYPKIYNKIIYMQFIFHPVRWICLNVRFIIVCMNIATTHIFLYRWNMFHYELPMEKKVPWNGAVSMRSRAGSWETLSICITLRHNQEAPADMHANALGIIIICRFPLA